jgi:hypothetical protein
VVETGKSCVRARALFWMAKFLPSSQSCSVLPFEETYSASKVILKWEPAASASDKHSTIKSIRSPGYRIPTDDDSGDISISFPPSISKTFMWHCGILRTSPDIALESLVSELYRIINRRIHLPHIDNPQAGLPLFQEHLRIRKLGAVQRARRNGHRTVERSHSIY